MIVNVSSISGVLAPSTMSSLAYGTAKAALIYMTRGLAVAMAPNVRVNCVAPAFTDTPWMSQHFGADYQQVVAKASVGLSAAAHRHSGRYRGRDSRIDYRRRFCHRTNTDRRRRVEPELVFTFQTAVGCAITVISNPSAVLRVNSVGDLSGKISRCHLEMTEEKNLTQSRTQVRSLWIESN